MYGGISQCSFLGLKEPDFGIIIGNKKHQTKYRFSLQELL